MSHTFANPEHGKPKQPPCEADSLLPSPATITPLGSSQLYGYGLMLCSSLGLSGMSLFVHISENKFGFPPISVLFVRSVIQASFALIYILYSLNVKAELSSMTVKQCQLLGFRGTVGAVAMIFYFVALSLLPVAIAVTIFFLSPIFVMIFSRIFLKEPITGTDGFAAVLSFTGLLLVSRADATLGTVSLSAKDQMVGVLCALIGAVLSAVAYVTQRGIGRSVHFMFSVFALGFACLIFSILLGGAVGPSAFYTQRNGLIAALIGSLFAFPGQCFLNKALQHCRAGPGMLIRNMDIPIVYFLGLAFLGERLALLPLIGSALVLSGALLIGLRQILL